MDGCLRSGMVKTRKEHKCHGCGEVIPIGTTIRSQTNVFDGEVYTLYMCDKCLNWCKGKNCKSCIESEDAGPGYIKECMRQNEVKG